MAKEGPPREGALTVRPFHPPPPHPPVSVRVRRPLPQHVLAHESVRARLLGRFPHGGDLLHVLVIHIDEGLLGLDGIGGDQRSFQQLVRIGLQQVPILERPRFMLTGVADKVVFRNPVVEDLLPFDPGGEPRSAAAPQAGPLDLRDDLVPRPPCDAGFPSLIPPLVHIGGNLPGTGAEVLNNASFFSHKSSDVGRRNTYPRPEWSAYYKSRFSRKSRLL